MKPLRHLQWHVKVPYPFTLDLKSFNESEFLMKILPNLRFSERDIIDTISSSEFPFRI